MAESPAVVGDLEKPALNLLEKIGLAKRRRYGAPKGRHGRARVGILTVIGEEFSAVQSALGTRANIPSTGFFVKNLAADRFNLDLVVSQMTARSNLPANGDTSHMIEAFRPQIIMLVGVGGGLTDNGQPRDGIALGDVVIGEYVSYVDFVKITDKGTFIRHYAIDHPSIALSRDQGRPISVASPRKIEQASPIGKTDFGVHLGEVVSSEKLMGSIDDPIQIELLAPFDKALVVDMESAGVARTVCERRSSFWYHPRYTVIRGISDMVGQAGNNQTRAEWKAFAAATAARVARDFIAALPPDLPE